MNDQRKTKAQLIQELNELHRKLDTKKGDGTTGHTPMEKKLKESEEKYRALFESDSDAIYIYDPDTTEIIDANNSTAEMYGYTKDELIGMSCLKFSAEVEQTSKVLIKIRQGENIVVLDRLHQKKDGTVFSVEIRSIAISYGGKDVFFAASKDITERKRAEDDLRLHSEIITNMTEGVYLIGAEDGAIKYANPKFEDMFGYSKGEMVGQHASIVNAPTDIAPEETANAIMEVLAANGEWHGEVNNIKKNGTQFWCYANVSVFDHPQYGSVLVAVHTDITERKHAEAALEQSHNELEQRVVERTNELAKVNQVLRDDITERKAAEEELRESNERYRNLVETSQDLIWRADAEGKFIYLNNALENVMGYTSEEMLGHAFSDYQHPEIAERDIREFGRHLAGGSVKGYETSWISKSGQDIDLSFNAIPLMDAKDNIIGTQGTATDITERKQFEQELLKAQKLESVGLLAGGLAHDFNNALTTIQLQAAVASMQDDVPASVEQALKEIDQTVSKAKSITQQMLTFSKGGAPVRMTSDLDPIIQESVRFALSGTNISPTFDFDKDLHYSEIDPDQINQVISNVILNASQAMPGGGTVRVVAKNISITAKNQLGLLEPGKYISVAISDEGVGVMPDNLNKIFDPYFTTKQAGSGLGLFSCYSIIDKHAGWITAESEPGEGCTITFYLPKSSAELPESAKTAPSGVTKGTGSILIMDDDERLRRTLAKLLISFGYQVSESADGEEALGVYAEASERGEPFDLVILDLTIPNGMGGVETVKKLLEIDPDVKAIVSSGYSNDAAVTNYKDYGFSAVLPKPYTLDMLAEVVKDTIEGE